MRKVYIVVGSTGEYSGREEWYVRAYTDEARARSHVELASARYREMLQECARQHESHGETWSATSLLGVELEREGGLRNEWDLNMAVDYVGTTYELIAVDLDEGEGPLRDGDA